MDDYEVSTYGERIAAVYDELFPAPDTEMAVERLAELAGSGRVLELGIGTGRLSLPLLARGIEVEGIDASEAMVARLRSKPGGDRIPVSIGDFAEVSVEGEFALVFVAFNTFFALLTQEDQLRCFRNVAARLAPGGAFVIEAFVPDLTRFDRGQRTSAVQVSIERVMLEVTRHDPARQRIDSQHVLLSDRVQLYPVSLRYAWPSELDLMGRLAGLRLRQRWGGWCSEPFTASSASHVSVYERPEA